MKKRTLEELTLIQIAERTFRIGVQGLWCSLSTGQYFVSIHNRSYCSIQPIPNTKVEIWRKILTQH